MGMSGIGTFAVPKLIQVTEDDIMEALTCPISVYTYDEILDRFVRYSNETIPVDQTNYLVWQIEQLFKLSLELTEEKAELILRVVELEKKVKDLEWQSTKYRGRNYNFNM